MSNKELEEKLRFVEIELQTERNRNKHLLEEIRQLKTTAAMLHQQVEQEEEFISNQLMKKLERLKTEKQQIALELEQEEEYLTNTLQRKLAEVRRSKIDMENELEAEQENIVHRLQRQIQQAGFEKKELELRLSQSVQQTSQRLLQSVATLRHTLTPAATDASSQVEESLSGLEKQILELNSISALSSGQDLHQELRRLREENELLKARLAERRPSLSHHNSPSITLDTDEGPRSHLSPRLSSPSPSSSTIPPITLSQSHPTHRSRRSSSSSSSHSPLILNEGLTDLASPNPLLSHSHSRSSSPSRSTSPAPIPHRSLRDATQPHHGRLSPARSRSPSPAPANLRASSRSPAQTPMLSS
eukprot:TRINITY_DN4501_c0_g1_i3.p1 TRINITY_DN4501_c0_g1~~TRINITY_DN4501_c0_g1_i3.p1  ORF type:complete len:359 (-),score=95.98 TRINITY_DN4501_c0_g1_i3:103-1179(-)